MMDKLLRMGRRDAGLLLASVAVGVTAMLIPWSWDVQAARTAESAPQAAVEAAPVEVRPWSIDMEDPEEDAKITAALVEQGYFRPDVPLSFELQDHLHAACGQYGVPYELALGLIEVESGFDPEAVNGGCYGLCQLNTRYHPADLEPIKNIWEGMRYLGEQLERYDTVEAALEGYHAGHDTGARTYARKVLAAAEKWR